ncbi:flagellar biosynthetic protein FliR [Massilia sp. MS-15]|uniref:flagellar biosynthetic protein FliR n=1 Tax=Massilia sp. MS-15 TaxID=2878200 RepID=UPI001CD681A0|nr:flagellar biosynthetic protein FliR [Massilia sp. MS-15]MCA1248638.1 flagellar biosynthetic protein FliR [Massilia sp. MS-15]
MLSLSTGEMNAWIAGLLWPLTRILGLVASAPLFGNTGVPMSVKVALGVLLASVIAPTVPDIPAIDPTSWGGLLILAKELLIGLAMGFAMRIVFAAIEYAGEIASMTMGLGFAVFFDPNSRGRSSAVSQFLALVATMAFLAVNAHLVLLAALAESFHAMPIAATPFSGNGPLELARWGGRIFSSGLQLALPVIAALLITNVALGILTRAAPQLNIFGIGFPVTLGVGFLTLSLAMPYLGMPIVNMFNAGIEAGRAVPRAAAPRPAPPPPAAPIPVPAP